jgi:hypothetical protein
MTVEVPENPLPGHQDCTRHPCVMAGLRPGHPREHHERRVRVDAWHKAGHDSGGSSALPRACRALGVSCYSGKLSVEASLNRTVEASLNPIVGALLILIDIVSSEGDEKDSRSTEDDDGILRAFSHRCALPESVLVYKFLFLEGISAGEVGCTGDEMIIFGLLSTTEVRKKLGEFMRILRRRFGGLLGDQRLGNCDSWLTI